MKTMKLSMIIIVCLIALNKLTSDEIELIKFDSWRKLTDNEQFNLCNDLIKLCNKTFSSYISLKIENESLFKKIKNFEKRKNEIIINTLFLLDLNLNIYLIFNLIYERKLINNPFDFSIGFGIAGGVEKSIYIKEETLFIGGLTFNLSFSF